jgi:hypothetical protein
LHAVGIDVLHEVFVLAANGWVGQHGEDGRLVMNERTQV